VIRKPTLRFILCSAIGIFVFFIPVQINGRSSILLDHIVTYIRNLPVLPEILGIAIVSLGGIYPWVSGSWKRSKTEIVFSVLKLLGAFLGFSILLGLGPSIILREDIGPFLFEDLVIPVGLIVPIGSIFFSFLVDYGLLEFVGTLMRPVMRRIWKTPGRSAVDAVASFVGSYSIALLITDRVFKEGKYTVREAAIIATGFSTVSTTFMIIVAQTLGMMDVWALFFLVSMVVTFAVTALTARLSPLSRMPDTYAAEGKPEEAAKGNILRESFARAVEASERAPGIDRDVMTNLKDGFRMSMSILPTILSIGTIGLLLANFTPVFDALAWIYYPFTLLVGLPEPFLAAKAVSAEIAEMFLPSLIAIDAPLLTRFSVGVVSISQILFFSASIPCLLSTDIPVSVPKILTIWVERTILSILITAPLALIFL